MTPDSIKIRQATPEDAKLLTDLSYTTFWDAFAHHPKNAPDDLAHYMRQAFSTEQIAAELADSNSIFLIASVDDKPAGYAKLIAGSPNMQAPQIPFCELENFMELKTLKLK